MATLQSQLKLTLIDQVSGRMRAMSAQMTAFQGRMTAMAAPLTGLTARVAAFGAGYLGVTAGMRHTAGAAIKFEEAFADVVKVLDATPGQLQEVRHQILEMSKVLPNSAEGIAAIYAQAAQSNIPLRELGKFSEMVAKVAVAWDTSEGDTSDALAKIKNQLNLNVEEIGLMADAINHLGNNTAAKAPDLVDFAKRVGAAGEMFGFTAQQTLAFGGAMVAAGGPTEVASTSFRNMGRALTIGTRATKSHQVAFRRLGLDAVKTAKNMQKNALGTTLDVLDRIGSLPEWEQISIASALFGDEARALMPVIANSTELRRQLALVGDEANYAGSAFEEYMVRAGTTANALQIIGNKLKAQFRSWGDGMLPSIKALGAGLGDVLDSMHKRVGIFDQINIAFNSLMTGLGYNGSAGLRALMNDLGDVLFGKAFEGEGIDQRVNELARLSNTFRDLGRGIREFTSAVAENPITKFFAQMSGYGFKLFLAAAGITILAGAVSKLAKAMMVLSGASAAIAIIKSVAGLGGALVGAGGAAAAAKTGAASGAVAGGGAAAGAMWKQILTRVPAIAAVLGTAYGAGHIASKLSKDNSDEARRLSSPRDAERDSMEAFRRYRDSGDFSDDMAARKPSGHQDTVGLSNSPAASGLSAIGNWFRELDAKLSASTGLRANTGSANDLRPEFQSLRDAVHSPSGTQNVNVTNPPPQPMVPVNVTVYATTNASADDIGRATGEQVKAAVESSFSD